MRASSREHRTIAYGLPSGETLRRRVADLVPALPLVYMSPMLAPLTIELRPYRRPDFEEAVAVWRASKRVAFPYVEIQQRYTRQDDARYFDAVLVAECAIWLAEVDERVAGLMALRDDLLDQMFVRVDLQRQGVGTALLQKAKQLSPTGLRLYTFQKNEPARRFYERHGFRIARFSVSAPPENEPHVEYCWDP